MIKTPIDFNAIRSFKELHRVLKSRKIGLEAEYTLESIEQPITFIKQRPISKVGLTEQVLRALRSSTIVEFNRKLNSEPPFDDKDLLNEFYDDKDRFKLCMLDDNDIQSGLAVVHKKTKNESEIIDILYDKLDVVIRFQDMNKAYQGYIKQNFTDEHIEKCVNNLTGIDLDTLEFDDELHSRLSQYGIDDWLSIRNERKAFADYQIKTNVLCNKAYTILMKPIIEFLLNHFKELEVWEISNDTTYYVVGRPWFFIGIFGYTHDGQFDGVVYKGYNET